MFITPRYANRTDLSIALKLEFSIEERIERSRAARAFYRGFVALPSWVTGIILAPLFAVGIALLFFGCAIGGGMDGEYPGDAVVGMAAYALLFGLVGYFVPLGWLLFAVAILCVLALKFDCLMEDYGRELERARRA